MSLLSVIMQKQCNSHTALVINFESLMNCSEVKGIKINVECKHLFSQEAAVIMLLHPLSPVPLGTYGNTGLLHLWNMFSIKGWKRGLTSISTRFWLAFSHKMFHLKTPHLILHSAVLENLSPLPKHECHCVVSFESTLQRGGIVQRQRRAKLKY